MFDDDGSGVCVTDEGAVPEFSSLSALSDPPARRALISSWLAVCAREVEDKSRQGQSAMAVLRDTCSAVPRSSRRSSCD